MRLSPFKGTHIDDTYYVVGDMSNHSLDIEKWDDIKAYENICVQYHMKSLQIDSYDEYTEYLEQEKEKFENFPDYALNVKELNIQDVNDKMELVSEIKTENDKEDEGKVEEAKSKFSFPNSRTDNKDIYETPNWVLEKFVFILKESGIINQETRFYDPCCGNHNIATVLRKFINSPIIYEADLYPIDETVISENYLESEFNDYDILITNPPYNIKTDFLEKCLSKGFYFLFLLLIFPR